MDNKKWISIASALVVVGLIIFAVVMSTLGWDFTKLNTSKHETNTHEISESFDSISISTKTADVRFLISEDGKCRVVCHEMEKTRHEVRIADGVLTVSALDTRAWYDYIGINLTRQSVTVYLPEDEYLTLVVKSNTGNVEIPDDFTFSELDVEVDTGIVLVLSSVLGSAKISSSTGYITVTKLSANELCLSSTTGTIVVGNARIEGGINATATTGSIKLSYTECGSLTASASTGSIYLTGVISSGVFSLETGTGSILFDSSDAREIYAKASTGSISGTLLTGKDFEARTSTGSIDVPRGTEGGLCDVETGTGDIKISIVAKPQ